MEKKYTKEQIDKALEKASTRALENDISVLEEIATKQNGEVDTLFITTNELKNIMFLGELRKLFWEEL